MRFLSVVAILAGCECSEECFGAEPNFESIQTKIFDRGCNRFTDCHSSRDSYRAGELDLCGLRSPDARCSPDTSPYERLVGVEASCVAEPPDPEDESCIEGTTILVVPGNPDESYLYRRVTGKGLSHGVDPMPPPDGLCETDADAIRKWIADGAEP